MPLVTPGPGRQRGDARLARDLRPALGRERGRGLVAHVDDVDALVAAAVVDREQVTAGEGEELGDTVCLQPARDEDAAVRLLRLGALGCRSLGLVLRCHRASLGFACGAQPTSLLRVLSEPLGVVLAGGRSSRMGASKASIELAGAPLIERPLRAMREARLEAVVVAKPDTDLPPLDVPVWQEPEEPSHPLTGIVAALEQGGTAAWSCAGATCRSSPRRCLRISRDAASRSS